MKKLVNSKSDVRSELPGSVWLHGVVVGQSIQPGTVVLVVECMRTEIPVVSPVAGTITWVRPCGEHFETGDVVATVAV